MFKYIILISLIIFLGIYYPKKSYDDLEPYLNHSVILSGWICEEDRGVYKQRLVLCVERLGEENVRGKTLISLSLYPSYHYGDYIIAKGFLKPPGVFDGFSYSNYLSRYDIYSLLYYPKIIRYQHSLSWLQRTMVKILNYKEKIKRIVEKNLPEPESGLALAMLLGYKRLVIKDDIAMFSRVGLSHIIAISGMHITIFSSFIIILFSPLIGRKRSKYLVYVFLSLYLIMIGFKTSALRASLFGLLGMFNFDRKKRNPLILLLFTAILMLLFNPKLLQYDLGFQLSFLAVLGIIYFNPLIQKVLFRKRRNIITDIVSISISVQLTTLPILLINFHQLSLIAPLSNIIVVSLLPFLLSSLIIVIMLSFLFPILSLYFFYFPYLLLHFIFFISYYLSSFPWASIAIDNYTWKEGVIYYIVLLAVFKVIQKPLSRSGL